MGEANEGFWEEETRNKQERKERNWVLDYQPLFEPTDKAKYFVL